MQKTHYSTSFIDQEFKMCTIYFLRHKIKDGNWSGLLGPGWDIYPDLFKLKPKSTLTKLTNSLGNYIHNILLTSLVFN